MRFLLSALVFLGVVVSGCASRAGTTWDIATSAEACDRARFAADARALQEAGEHQAGHIVYAVPHWLEPRSAELLQQADRSGRGRSNVGSAGRWSIRQHRSTECSRALRREREQAESGLDQKLLDSL